MNRYLFIFIMIFFLGLSLYTPKEAQAYTLVKRSEIGIDEKLSDQNKKTLQGPTNITFTRIQTPIDEYMNNPRTWVKSIYYYYITRLGYLDVPFNYIIDRDGVVYEGRSGGNFVDPETELKNGNIVIAYLSNSEDVSGMAATSIKQLVTELSYKYGIKRKNVLVSTMYIANVTDGISKSAFKEDSSDFSKSLNQLLNTYSYSDKEHIAYKAEIKDLKYNSSVKSTEKFTVELTVVNKGETPWFTNKDYVYISTKNLKDSQFAVNGKWESFSKPYAITEKTVLPNEEVKISFDMQAMLLPGKATQKFVLMKLPSNIFEGSDFSVNFEIAQGSYKLVKIVDIPALNVRKCIGPSCEVVTQVGENQVFIMLEKNAGWYRIQYSEKGTGWVYGKYVSEL